MATRISPKAANSSHSIAPSIVASPKSDIRVVLDDHYASKVFTSLSPVAGHVSITTKRLVAFESIQIVLLGQTKTSFDGMSAPQEITHTFLKMVMPVPESTYPVPRVLEPGETYTVPFNFVIPSQLTINACNHERLADQVQQHHLLLPPTLGGWERDDMGPRMARVEYAIKARVIRDDGDGRKVRVMEACHPINVLPASVEEPPLSVSDSDNLYRMSKTKTLRRSLLATRYGRITAEAIQPGPAVLSPDGRRVMTHPMAHIRLTFEPEESKSSSSARPVLLPGIKSVSAKLAAHTFFSSGTISSFPNLGEWHGLYQLDRRGHYSTSVSLPPATFSEQPGWAPVNVAQQTTSSITRRDSGYAGSDSSSSSGVSIPSSSLSQSVPKLVFRNGQYHRVSQTEEQDDPKKPSQQQQTYTTTLSIPIALPTDKKTLVPTFHSCIASRVYALHLTIALAGSAGEKLALVVPVQVAVGSSSESASTNSPEFTETVATAAAAAEGGGSAESRSTTTTSGTGDQQEHDLPTFEEAAADAHLRPRVLHAPPEWQLRMQEERLQQQQQQQPQRRQGQAQGQLEQHMRGGFEGLVAARVYVEAACGRGCCT
ncbi:hypothetical protein VTJ49DRAFT_752 [Mycothermus thermophilus]|uniref:Bul1 C-terminal domain-containing protein n=1 Tax=Humicola insolens TaxID=85995 RepID=A0ABR3VG96_HUMIN